MTTWTKDLDFSRKTMGYVNEILSNNISDLSIFEADFADDKYKHIDAYLEKSVRGKVYEKSLQIKVLRFSSSKFNAVTIEYLQNIHTNEGGEFFHGEAERYFFAYANEKETGLMAWWYIDYTKLRNWLRTFNFVKDDFKLGYGKLVSPDNTLEFAIRANKGSASNASLINVDIVNIPSDFIIWSGTSNGAKI